MKQLQDEVDASVPHYVAIRETTSVGQFVEALKLDKTEPDKPTAVHLDLAHILPVSADVWLFELLVVGAVRDPIAGKVYHRRRADHFYIEVPNSPHERTASSLSFCALVPVSFLRMEASRLEFKQPEFPDGGDRVAFVDNDKLLNTCHFLHAMEKKVFLPGSEHFDGEWLVELQPQPETSKAYATLCRTACSDGSPPSFQLFVNFSKFVGAQCCNVAWCRDTSCCKTLVSSREWRCLTSSIPFAVFLWRHPRTSASAKYAHPDIEVTEELSRAANARVLARALPTLERTVSGGNGTHGVLPGAPPLNARLH